MKFSVSPLGGFSTRRWALVESYRRDGGSIVFKLKKAINTRSNKEFLNAIGENKKGETIL